MIKTFYFHLKNIKKIDLENIKYSKTFEEHLENYKNIKIIKRKKLEYFIILFIIKKYFNYRKDFLEFKFNRFLKPQINNFFISITNSNNLIMISIADKEEVGIDCEFVDEKKYIHNDLREELRKQAESNSMYELLKVWTKHEAYLKRIGLYISKEKLSQSLKGYIYTDKLEIKNEIYVYSLSLSNEIKRLTIENFNNELKNRN